METKRNYASIARRVIGPEDDGQNVQQFMSDLPWSAQAVIQQVQRKISATPGLSQGGVLLLDESADEKAGLARHWILKRSFDLTSVLADDLDWLRSAGRLAPRESEPAACNKGERKLNHTAKSRTHAMSMALTRHWETSLSQTTLPTP